MFEAGRILEVTVDERLYAANYEHDAAPIRLATGTGNGLG